jgi:predicted AAA+ superfamily ATPase
MIPRQAAVSIREKIKHYPVLAVTGPRQAGKSTLVKSIFPEKPYVSLEDLDTRQFATDDPRAFLAQCPEGAILDEVQRCPDLFSYLQTFYIYCHHIFVILTSVWLKVQNFIFMTRALFVRF